MNAAEATHYTNHNTLVLALMEATAQRKALRHEGERTAILTRKTTGTLTEKLAAAKAAWAPSLASIAAKDDEIAAMEAQCDAEWQAYIDAGYPAE